MLFFVLTFFFNLVEYNDTLTKICYFVNTMLNFTSVGAILKTKVFALTVLTNNYEY